MTNSFLVSLRSVDVILPDGRPLFRDLNETLLAESVGLIGRNGSGKTILGQLIAGSFAPTSGRIERHVVVRHVRQQIDSTHVGSLAELAGLAAPIEALRRLSNGNGSVADLELVADRWDLEARWCALLDRAGLDEKYDRSNSLSGGQRTLLTLIGAFCSDAGLLILDEPSNHLDRARRELLKDEIARWCNAGRGLILISHDRQLLANVNRTLEITSTGLRRYGGGWETVQQQRGTELAAASARLDHARTARRRARLEMIDQAERAARRTARGERNRGDGGQAKMILDAMAERADHSNGARIARHAERFQALDREVTDAFSALGDSLEQPAFPDLGESVPAGKQTLVIEGMVPPWGWTDALDFIATGPVRIAICGANGCGKTTLLHLIAGRLQPLTGRCETTLRTVLLDQSLELLDREHSIIDLLRERARGVPEAQARQWLALAGIKANHVHRPVETLSGGEQLRGALLCLVCSQPPARLLLLDEPTNHLDLHAVEALESMLQSWRGALVVASHDEVFLGHLKLTHRMERRKEGWEVLNLS